MYIYICIARKCAAVADVGRICIAWLIVRWVLGLGWNPVDIDAGHSTILEELDINPLWDCATYAPY